jgi:RNA recognition motif-containing protein
MQERRSAAAGATAAQPAPRTNLIVNYLPHSITTPDLYTIFSPYGAVAQAKVILDRNTNKSMGFGFVRYATEADSAAAVAALNGAPLGNKRIKVSVARPSSHEIRHCKLHIANLPAHYTHADVSRVFGAYGTIIECRVLNSRNSNSNGNGSAAGEGGHSHQRCNSGSGSSISCPVTAFVQFDKRSEAQAALDALDSMTLTDARTGGTNSSGGEAAESNGHPLGGSHVRPLHIKFAEDHHRAVEPRHSSGSLNGGSAQQHHQQQQQQQQQQMGHLRRNKSSMLGSGSAGGGTPPSSMTHSEAGDYSSAQWQYGLPSPAGVMGGGLQQGFYGGSAAAAAAAAWQQQQLLQQQQQLQLQQHHHTGSPPQQQLSPVDGSSSHSMGQRLYSGSFDNGSSVSLAAAAAGGSGNDASCYQPAANGVPYMGGVLPLQQHALASPYYAGYEQQTPQFAPLAAPFGGHGLYGFTPLPAAAYGYAAAVPPPPQQHRGSLSPQGFHQQYMQQQQQQHHLQQQQRQGQRLRGGAAAAAAASASNYYQMQQLVQQQQYEQQQQLQQQYSSIAGSRSNRGDSRSPPRRQQQQQRSSKC